MRLFSDADQLPELPVKINNGPGIKQGKILMKRGDFSSCDEDFRTPPGRSNESFDPDSIFSARLGVPLISQARPSSLERRRQVSRPTANNIITPRLYSITPVLINLAYLIIISEIDTLLPAGRRSGGGVRNMLAVLFFMGGLMAAHLYYRE